MELGSSPHPDRSKSRAFCAAWAYSRWEGASSPPCDDACDSNDDGTVNISDAIMTLGFLFLGQGFALEVDMDEDTRLHQTSS